MSKGARKRQLIFDKYTRNQNLLIGHNFIKGELNKYRCPLCAKYHNSINEEDPLTLEDAPPKSLGGKSKTLTCKSCNNRCGHNIDFHLTERLKEIDNAKFLPNTETRVKIKFERETLNGTVRVSGNGDITIYHNDKNNNPTKLEEALTGIKGGEFVDLTFLKTRVVPEQLEHALLKTGYIMAFEKLGNSIIFDPVFDIVRDQLQKPHKNIYPSNFWMVPEYPKEMEGVYFVINEGLECILVLFNLDTGSSFRKFGVFLPTPVQGINDVIKKLNERFVEDKRFEMNLYPYEQDGELYLNDLTEIKTMFDWIEGRQKKWQLSIQCSVNTFLINFKPQFPINPRSMPSRNELFRAIDSI